MNCIECGKKIGVLDDRCPYCDAMQYDDEPVKEPIVNKTVKKGEEPLFSAEEILALGLYPKDERYKMSLISQITGKR